MTVIRKFRALLKYLLDPPWQPDGPHPLTLAVPDARSTFNRGSSGWASRPNADIRCPLCRTEFTHDNALEMIDCPYCRFECEPDDFGRIEIERLVCPDCGSDMNYGIRHPNLFEFPQWASCPECQFHWEFQHSLRVR